MNRFVLKNTFIKVYIKVNKKSKLCFGDRVDVLNDFFYKYGGNMCKSKRTHITKRINNMYLKFSVSISAQAVLVGY